MVVSNNHWVFHLKGIILGCEMGFGGTTIEGNTHTTGLHEEPEDPEEEVPAIRCSWCAV